MSQVSGIRAPGGKERGHEAWALRLRGEIAAETTASGIELAEAAYRQALAIADELGMRPLAVHCHLGLGMLYRRARRPGPARRELAAGAHLFGATKMTFWLPRVETELAAP
ncbi:MAG: hypothetical protein ACREJV_02480 [Candidatus Rokuibacteriota bacterium]